MTRTKSTRTIIVSLLMFAIVFCGFAGLGAITASAAEDTYTITYRTYNGVYTSEDYSYGDTITPPPDPLREGYTFTGWDKEIPATMPAEDLTITATWEINQYTITFVDTGDIEYQSITQDYETKVEEIADPVKTGYTFIGWDIEIPKTMPAENLTITALWGYSVTLNIGDGTINSGNVTKYSYGVGATLPTDVTRTGYTFGGWYLQEDFSGDAVTEITTTDIGNKVFYAKWTANIYSVTLTTNDGTINSGNVTEYTYGVGATLPTDVTKEGFTFGGWYTDNKFSGEPVTVIATDAVGDRTYYAKWIAELKYETYGGTINDPVTEYTYGVGATLPTDVTKEGFTFGGWYTDNKFSGEPVTVIATDAVGDRTYYAKWIAELKYETYGGTLNDGHATEYVYGIGATLTTSVRKTGYEFLGWYDNPEFTGEPVTAIPTDAVGNKIYYAKWTEATYAIDYAVYGGTINDPVTEYTYGVGATLPTDVTKEGFTFGGWYQTNNFSDERVSVIGSEEYGSKYYYAKWIADINYETNGGTINGEYATEYLLNLHTYFPADVTKTGYTFGGWYDNEACEGNAVTVLNPGSSPAKTYYAKWIANTYTVDFELYGGNINALDVREYTYGIGAILPTDVTRADHTFGGWYLKSDFSGEAVTTITATDTGNKLYYAKWIANDTIVNALKAVEEAQTKLDEAIKTKADAETVNAAIKELQDAIDALEEVKDNYVAADSALKQELEGKIISAQTTLQTAITALSDELDATNEKVDQLETFIIIVCVISGVALCGSGAFVVWFFIDRKKRI